MKIDESLKERKNVTLRFLYFKPTEVYLKEDTQIYSFFQNSGILNKEGKWDVKKLANYTLSDTLYTFA